MPSTTPDRLRLFFALWPDDGARAALAVLAAGAGGRARPVATADLHLTLLFLGATDASRLGEIRDAASRVAFEPFRLTLDRIDHWRRPRLLCALPATPPDALLRLAGSLAGAIGDLGLPLERRPFRPHVTLARKVTEPAPRPELDRPVAWAVGGFALVASGPATSGPRYRSLARWPAVETPHP